MNQKLKSRKFVVWLATTILTVISLSLNFFVDNTEIASLSKVFAEGYVVISSIYIGGNVAQKFTKNNEEVNNDAWRIY